jgi:hypothetical protein
MYARLEALLVPKEQLFADEGSAINHITSS